MTTSTFSLAEQELSGKELPLAPVVLTSTSLLTPGPLPPTMLLICDDPVLAADLENTVAAAMPGTAIRRLSSLDGTAAAEEPTVELLILGDPTGETLAAATAARDTAGLPRWAVVVCRSSPNGDDDNAPNVILQRDLSAPFIRRVCQCAKEHHRLRRENAQYRGDLSTFGFRVAHDLRTPLGGVLTTTEMLKEILSDDSPTHVPLTQPIIDSADGLVKLIERTSYLAKISASDEPPVQASMATPFWNAFQQAESLILRAGASLTYPSEWPMFNGHPAWMEIVWSNFIANALQHGGAHVRMEAGWSREGSVNRFWLNDTGSVPPERRPGLFHPFNRLHEPRAPRGLGLPIVRRIVERENGSCGYAPLTGGGSCFYFVLPVADEQMNPAH